MQVENGADEFSSLLPSRHVLTGLQRHNETLDALPLTRDVAMAGNPTGAMGLAEYLDWDWRSHAGVPIVNVPGCPVQPDNMTETLLYLLTQAAGHAPMIPLDDRLRPTWLFSATVHEGCDRAGYYEQADFANEYGSPKCLVRIGCWGPVVNCNVTKRGWMNGLGGRGRRRRSSVCRRRRGAG